MIKTEKVRRDCLFKGKGFENGKYIPLQPENYPPNYRHYIEEEKILLKHELKGANSVLDAGVGIGRLIPEIAPLVKRFVCINNSDFMLREAYQIAKFHPNVELRKSEIENLGDDFPRTSFDYSLCLWNTLGNLRDEKKALRELAKVTKEAIYITVHHKGRLEDRKNWYRSVGIHPTKIDQKNERFYFEGGLESKSYSLVDMTMLARQNSLVVEESKILGDVVLYVKLGHKNG